MNQQEQAEAQTRLEMLAWRWAHIRARHQLVGGVLHCNWEQASQVMTLERVELAAIEHEQNLLKHDLAQPVDPEPDDCEPVAMGQTIDENSEELDPPSRLVEVTYADPATTVMLTAAGREDLEKRRRMDEVNAKWSRMQASEGIRCCDCGRALSPEEITHYGATCETCEGKEYHRQRESLPYQYNGLGANRHPSLWQRILKVLFP